MNIIARFATLIHTCSTLFTITTAKTTLLLAVTTFHTALGRAHVLTAVEGTIVTSQAIHPTAVLTAHITWTEEPSRAVLLIYSS